MLELLNVNPSSGEPIYRQLTDQVVRLIVGGQLQAGQVLPSVRQMAEHLAVNPMTVSRAVQQLVEQGWLERRRGQPTRVANRTVQSEAEQASLLQPKLEDLIAQAKQLGLSEAELVALVTQHWSKD